MVLLYYFALFIFIILKTRLFHRDRYVTQSIYKSANNCNTSIVNYSVYKSCASTITFDYFIISLNYVFGIYNVTNVLYFPSVKIYEENRKIDSLSYTLVFYFF